MDLQLASVSGRLSAEPLESDRVQEAGVRADLGDAQLVSAESELVGGAGSTVSVWELTKLSPRFTLQRGLHKNHQGLVLQQLLLVKQCGIDMQYLGFN